MNRIRQCPYGSWTSPIAARTVAASAVRLSSIVLHGEDIYWIEGLGGNSSIRGLPKNRFVGKGLVMLNTDLRWRFAEFSLRHKPAHLVLSGFVDLGRVWSESIRLDELGSGLNSGYGGGMRVGLGPSFVVAFDVGRSPQSNSTQIYIGLGYPF